MFKRRLADLFGDGAPGGRRGSGTSVAPSSASALTGTVLPPLHSGIGRYQPPEVEPVPRSRWSGRPDYARHEEDLDAINRCTRKATGLVVSETQRQRAMTELALEVAQRQFLPEMVELFRLRLETQLLDAQGALSKAVRQQDQETVEWVHAQGRAEIERLYGIAGLTRAEELAQKQHRDALAPPAPPAPPKQKKKKDKETSVVVEEGDPPSRFRTAEFSRAYEAELYRQKIAADAEQEEHAILAKVNGDVSKLSFEDRRALQLIRQAQERAIREHGGRMANVAAPEEFG